MLWWPSGSSLAKIVNASLKAILSARRRRRSSLSKVARRIVGDDANVCRSLRKPLTALASIGQSSSGRLYDRLTSLTPSSSSRAWARIGRPSVGDGRCRTIPSPVVEQTHGTGRPRLSDWSVMVRNLPRARHVAWLIERALAASMVLSTERRPRLRKEVEPVRIVQQGAAEG